ncbi:hypothetical protein COR50_07515 [Chitinophaga caeni]|uniref:Gliding motility lipoprotein GldB n=1 Tax=Chitinophaga caeni TaxID=2029983 RepID=A0A291QT45_9BACT|nr:hypothetical protein [Chitinophaga caeni]ATL47043.1 hypothetical protein COR50_07515 [Chitinophaga caeni]
MQNYINKYSLRLLAFTGLALFLFACQNRKDVPDISNIHIDVKVHRFDQDLMQVDTNNVPAGLKLLQAQYPTFFPTYVQNIMNMGVYSDTNQLVAQQMRQLLTTADIRHLQDTINTRFKDLKPLEQSLSEAFRYTKYYFPDFKAPEVVSFMSAISNFGAITVDSVLGIGLDMYLGEDFSVYTYIPDLPGYMVRKFAEPYIVPNAMLALAQKRYPYTDASNLIEEFVNLGRYQYFLDEVLPFAADSTKTGYSGEQLKWCYENEEMVYQFFVMNNLLYTTDFQDIMRYTNEGPSTQGMPAGSPGKIGLFVGWQIVKAYMDKHPQVSLRQLMEEKTTKEIFNEAKYRPRR